MLDSNGPEGLRMIWGGGGVVTIVVVLTIRGGGGGSGRRADRTVVTSTGPAPTSPVRWNVVTVALMSVSIVIGRQIVRYCRNAWIAAGLLSTGCCLARSLR